jgi:hypothetical protein
MKIIAFIFSILALAPLTSVLADENASCSPPDKEPSTVSTAVGDALGKTKAALTKIKDLPTDLATKLTDKTLQQIGFSMDGIIEAFECVGPIVDLLEKVSRDPHDQQTHKILKDNRCRGVIKEFAYKCINPKILIAMAIPGVGVAISSACQTIQHLKEKLDDVVKEDVSIYEKKGQEPESCPKEHGSGAPAS